MRDEKIAEEVFRFIIANLFISEDKLTFDTHIFKEGLVDSLGLVSLIDYLNSTFQIDIEEEEIVEENFYSINAISDFVGGKIDSFP
jgi:acyl carrier protein